MDRPKNVSIAKWGAACSPCALAKAKCLRSNEIPGTKCDRCERLEKDCVNQVHKPRKKRQRKPSRTAQLEEKLNSLVDLLKNSGEVSASTRHPSESSIDASSFLTAGTGPSVPLQRQTSLGGNSGVSNGSSGGVSAIVADGTTYDASQRIPRFYNDYAPQICVCREPVGEIPMPSELDEVLLATFVQRLMPEYPFVALPQGITAPELASTKPFLFATIRMVSSYRNLRSMRAQNYLITRHISEQMIMRSERSLEMLQSILLVLGYYHYHCMMHAQMNNLTALANSLIADLGINRAPEGQEKTRLILLNPETPRARTNEERRALCGVWYMNSIVALAFHRIDPIKYTSYVDQCLRELEVSQECETDSLLVHLVRIQHLSERISKLHTRDHFDDDLHGIARAPLNAYFGVFQNELDKYKAALPRHLRSNKVILCHLNTATLRLWEPPVIDAALLEKISHSLTTLAPSGAASSLDIFYRSHAALRSWFDYWLAIDVTEYFTLPMPLCAQLINAVTMLSRWAKLSSPDFGNTPTSPPPPLTMVAPTTLSSSSSSSSSAIPQSLHNLSSSSADTSPINVAGSSDPSMMFRMKDQQQQQHHHQQHQYQQQQQQHPDPGIPAAVSAVKAHFLSQPELQIDVLGILHAMSTRFEAARRQVLAQRQGGGAGAGAGAGTGVRGERGGESWENNNIWDLAGRKISLMRCKLERWAEIVASIGGGKYDSTTATATATTTSSSTTAGEDHDDDDNDDDDEEMPSDQGMDRGSWHIMEGNGVVGVDLGAAATTGADHCGGGGGGGNHHHHQQQHQQQQQQQQLNADGWQSNASWATDLFEGLGLDQNFFFDGPGDYGTIILNSFGSNGT
ncbi:hypothetical protein F4778DRAFT_284551 [Xylariomycetidae sp. FL2044]|nr:hypothetical protein F4778DRAFT_284551 [Xylariomycetidae sp. FL2044]